MFLYSSSMLGKTVMRNSWSVITGSTALSCFHSLISSCRLEPNSHNSQPSQCVSRVPLASFLGFLHFAAYTSPVADVAAHSVQYHQYADSLQYTRPAVPKNLATCCQCLSVWRVFSVVPWEWFENLYEQNWGCCVWNHTTITHELHDDWLWCCWNSELVCWCL
jgi:hypothetical protein